MATSRELTSIAAAVKSRTDRTPPLRARAGTALESSLPQAGRRRVKHANNLYDVEVVEEHDDRVKIHYTGYTDRFDQWISRSDVVYRPPCTPMDCEENSPLYLLACNIKQKLWPSKTEDPLVKVYMPFSEEAFRALATQGKVAGVIRGCKHYRIESYGALSEFLGDQWFIRVANIHGDFSYVILETIDFHFFRSRPLKDYAIDFCEDGSLRFTPAYIEQGHSLFSICARRWEQAQVKRLAVMVYSNLYHITTSPYRHHTHMLFTFFFHFLLSYITYKYMYNIQIHAEELQRESVKYFHSHPENIDDCE